MPAAVDIAGAVAPAAAMPPSASDMRADGAGRSGNAAGAAKSQGAKAGGAGKAGTDEAGAFDDFDAQLDAALPDSDDAQDAKAPKAASKAGGKSPKAADESKGRGSDSVPTAAVLTPWTFIQPVEVTPVKADTAGSAVEGTENLAAAGDAGVTSVGPAGATGTEGTVTTVGDASALAKKITPGTGAKTKATALAADAAPAKDAALAQDAALAKDAAPATGVAPTTNAAPATNVAAGPDGAPAVEEERTKVGESTAGGATKAEPASTTAGKAPVPEAALTQPNAEASSAAAAPASTPAAQQKAQQLAVATAEAAQAQAANTAEPAAAGAGALPNPTSAVPMAPVQPRATAEVPVKDASVAAAARGARGDKSSSTGRAISAFRAGTQTDVSQSDGQGKGHTSRVDASANAGSVDQRRGPSSEDNSATTAPPVAAEPKASDVPVQHDGAPVAAAAHEGQPVTMVVAGVGGLGSNAGLGDVLISGDAPAVSTGDVPDADTPHRLVQSLRMQFQRGGGDAIVQLSPEHLGPVTVSLRVEQGSVEARITAANPVVAEWLESHHETLREGLQASGLTLDRLVVDRDGRSPDRRERRESPARQRFRPAAEAKSTFELTI